MTLGDNLRMLREQAGYTQTKLAELSKIKQQSISRWELNQNIPNIEDCIILANFYGISLDELVGRDFFDK